MRKPLKRVLRCIGILSLLVACQDSEDNEAVDGSIDPSTKACQLNWNVASVVPCVAAPNLGMPPLIYSSHVDADGLPACEPYIGFPQPVPEAPWSEQSLIAETTGNVRLCIAMKHGSAEAPSADDCALFEYCLDANYDVAGSKQALPPLPSWAATDEACSRSYYADGGYVELRASSDALGCSTDGEQITRVQMCPLDCVKDSTLAKCKNCASKTSVTGEF